MLKHTVGVLMTQTCGGTSICLNDLLRPLAKRVKKTCQVSWLTELDHEREATEGTH